MAVHYTKERSKYGTMTGSIIVWPVEISSPNDPNNRNNVDVLPAGYLRCDGSKYNAKDFPLLAEICGTGVNCKFLKFDQNNVALTSLGVDEFVVPDLGSKYPRPVSGGDAGVFNNILTETKTGTFIRRSGISIEATSNVGDVAELTYSGKFILPSQIIPLKGKPSWTWGTLGYLDIESVDARMIHPHMHFSSTSRVRIKSKSAATGGAIPIEGDSYFSDDSVLNSSFNGTSFVSYGSGTGEFGGFASPGYGNGYVAFGGSGGSLISTREWTFTLTNNGNTLITIVAITGNDFNGGERPNNTGEGLYLVWPDGTVSASPIIPSRGESGLVGSQYDAQYASWLTQTLPIPQAYRQGTFTFKLRQQIVSITNEQKTPGGANAYDHMGVVQVGLGGGFTVDPNLTGGENDVPTGINYFKTASTVDVQGWLDNTKASSPSNSTPGSGQPACWAIASGNLAGTEKSDVNLITPLPVIINEVNQYYNFCDTGCSLSNLRCFCLLNEPVKYDLEQDWFGIEGTRTNDLTDTLGFCFEDFISGNTGTPWTRDGTAAATYVEGKKGVPSDWRGIPLSDVLPLNSNITRETIYPQARNVYSETEEVTLDGDPTSHNHKITVERLEHSYEIVTDAILVEPDNLNTTLQLKPSSSASIDVATSPFIVLEYLIKT
jgi:hypothetical protein